MKVLPAIRSLLVLLFPPIISAAAPNDCCCDMGVDGCQLEKFCERNGYTCRTAKCGGSCSDTGGQCQCMTGPFTPSPTKRPVMGGTCNSGAASGGPKVAMAWVSDQVRRTVDLLFICWQLKIFSITTLIFYSLPTSTKNGPGKNHVQQKRTQLTQTLISSNAVMTGSSIPSLALMWLASPSSSLRKYWIRPLAQRMFVPKRECGSVCLVLLITFPRL